MYVLTGEAGRRTQCPAAITTDRLPLRTAVAVHQVSSPLALTKNSRPTVFIGVPFHGFASGPDFPRSTARPVFRIRSGVQ
ncbi:hypothetical protein [Streptomyces mobaraensis]|uniref:hypothetical protein n=1 Tax=Streptomyces mobaraensis TaxID=35621 RepID=UPI001CCC89D2|nr:hypothetical protein [Streptomyces mobaraensis]UBI37314.1 hypothetical protein K7I03_13135 [Streptomyces mobaraensis]